MCLVHTWKCSCLWFQLPKSIFENNLPFAIISLSQFYCLHIAYKEIKEKIGNVSFFFKDGASNSSRKQTSRVTLFTHKRGDLSSLTLDI